MNYTTRIVDAIPTGRGRNMTDYRNILAGVRALTNAKQWVCVDVDAVRQATNLRAWLNKQEGVFAKADGLAVYARRTDLDSANGIDGAH